MIALLDGLALAVSAAGLLALLLAGLRRGHWRAGAQMALTLWTAAGLLRLVGLPDARRVAAAAAILAVRHLVVFALRPASHRGIARR